MRGTRRGKFILSAAASALALVGCNGNAMVIRLADEAAGARCGAGGVAVQSGLDTNRNGVLDDDEVDGTLTRFICSGAAGPVGAAGQAGADGTAGGTGPSGAPGEKGDTGDRGEPGSMGPIGEKGDTGAKGDTGDTGATGTNAIVTVTDEPSGANCRYGGQKVIAGVDEDRDGVLSAEEIDATRYLCKESPAPVELVTEYAYINTEAELEVLKDVTHISGGRITFETEVVELPALISADEITISRKVKRFWAPNLKSAMSVQVDGDVGEPLELDISSLEYARRLQIRDRTMTALNLPEFKTATSAVDLTEVKGLMEISMPKLAWSDDLWIKDNPDLQALLLPSLKGLESTEISGNTSLTQISMPVVESARQNVKIINNASLTSISMPLFEDAESLTLSNNSLLASVNLPSLMSIKLAPNSWFSQWSDNGRLKITGNTSLTSVSAPLLRRADFVEVANNAALSECDVERLVSALASEPKYGFVQSNNNIGFCRGSDYCSVREVPGIPDLVKVCRTSIAFAGIDDDDELCDGAGDLGYINYQAGPMWFASEAEYLAFKSAVRAAPTDIGLVYPSSFYLDYSDTYVDGAWEHVAAGQLSSGLPASGFWKDGEGADVGVGYAVFTTDGMTADSTEGMVRDEDGTASYREVCRVLRPN